jgi:hypothetical protein
MITGGIAARHPKLRIAFSHGGGALGMLLPRLVHAWKVTPKAKESLAESPAVDREALSSTTRWCSTAGACASSSTPSAASQICVGSDYPFNMGDRDPLGTLEKAGLDAACWPRYARPTRGAFLGSELAPGGGGGSTRCQPLGQLGALGSTRPQRGNTTTHRNVSAAHTPVGGGCCSMYVGGGGERSTAAGSSTGKRTAGRKNALGRSDAGGRNGAMPGAACAILAPAPHE